MDVYIITQQAIGYAADVVCVCVYAMHLLYMWVGGSGRYMYVCGTGKSARSLFDFLLCYIY